MFDTLPLFAPFKALAPNSAERTAIRALVLVPTRELAEQVTNFTKSTLVYCNKDVVVLNIAGDQPAKVQK
jgi:ATP-dependent RNA helicase DDX56/DBP9